MKVTIEEMRYKREPYFEVAIEVGDRVTFMRSFDTLEDVFRWVREMTSE